MYSDQGHSDEHWRIQDILEYLNLNNNNSAEELLQSILTCTDVQKEKLCTKVTIYEELILLTLCGIA